MPLLMVLCPACHAHKAHMQAAMPHPTAHNAILVSSKVALRRRHVSNVLSAKCPQSLNSHSVKTVPVELMPIHLACSSAYPVWLARDPHLRLPARVAPTALRDDMLSLIDKQPAISVLLVDLQLVSVLPPVYLVPAASRMQ